MDVSSPSCLHKKKDSYVNTQNKELLYVYFPPWFPGMHQCKRIEITRGKHSMRCRLYYRHSGTPLSAEHQFSLQEKAKRDAHPQTTSLLSSPPANPQTSRWYSLGLELRRLDSGAIRASGLFCQVPSEARVSLLYVWQTASLSGSEKTGGRPVMN